MRCDRERCWRLATVRIPGLGQWCSGHVMVTLGTWPTRHYRELETKVRAAVRVAA